MINRELLRSESAKIDISLDDTALARFDEYARLLIEWNNNINLTSITTPDEIVTKHFVDSLSILKYVDIPDSASIIDVGTGAGFPGMPLLIARPDINITFLDSLKKRLGFIDEVLNVNSLSASLVHGRAEDMGNTADYREQFDFATARAVAPLNVLCEYCMPFVKVGGRFVSMKGASARDELDCAENAIATLGGELESFFDFNLANGDKRSIIIIKKVSQTPTNYPRRSKKIDTKPL